MNGRKKIDVLITFALIFLLVFIWGNSCLSTERSDALSRCVMRLVFNSDGSQPDFGHSHHILRKAAHMCEFMLLAALLCIRFRRRRRPLLFGCFAAPAAALDETIQIFSGRGSAVKDVLIDCSGAAVGIILIFLIVFFPRRKRTK